MLEDAQANLILTNNQNMAFARKVAPSGCQLMNIDELDTSMSTRNSNLSISPKSFAYILYTSGSTGQPKGVEQNHRHLLHNVMEYTNAFHFCKEDRLTLLTSSTAQAIDNTFCALLNGASLYPFDVKEEGVTRLANWMTENEITSCFAGSPLFRNFLDTLTGEEEFPHLRAIRLGSQTAIKRDVELYKKHFSPNCILINVLASTETGIIRWYFIDKETQITTATVPVGYPDEDMKVLLLDDDGKRVGFGQIGEIAVQSQYLSPGYWRRPELTEAMFLPDPEGGDERIYLSGDLGRMLPDGCLEHLGRKDFRVKIRGNRVELAEVEGALLNLNTVKDAVVVAREAQAGDQRLIAYLVPAEKPAPTVTALRHLLAETLPDYMFPSTFVIMDSLPQTPNGKLDRQALPDPGYARPQLEASFVGPRTPVEQGLTDIWAEVLGLEQVGIHDNFLELGGDSLLAGQVMSRVISEFRVDLPLRSLFQAPTVADMSLAITQRRAKAADQADIDRMLAELETLSTERAKELLAEESSTGIPYDRS